MKGIKYTWDHNEKEEEEEIYLFNIVCGNTNSAMLH